MSIFDVSVPVQAGEQGLARITKFEVSEQDSRLTALRSIQHPGEYVRPGHYTRLVVAGRLMMTDTLMERRTNSAFVHHAHGRVLIAGLGIGLILEAILDNPEVKTVTVVEKYQDVIDLVAPSYLDRYADKLTVIAADIFDWRPMPKSMTYNTIYFDVWPEITGGNLPEMGRLHRAFRRHLDKTDPEAWMDSWQREYLKAAQRAERRRGGWY